ncbi:MAG: LD-carboxypeptidase, partial [Planctomycetota bacterium]
MPLLLSKSLFNHSYCLLAILSLLACSTTGQQPKLVKPKALKTGDTIALVAPAGPIDQAGLSLATERLEGMGFKVLAAEDLLRRNGYLAGSDERRTEELMDAFRNPEVDAVFPARGGYGAGRILERLDYDLIRRSQKVLIGFSDITALHLAIQNKSNMVTFHSPVPMWGLGSPNGLPEISAHWFWRAILRDRYESGQVGYLIKATWPEGSPEKYDSICHLDPPYALVGGKATGAIT